MNHTLSRSTVAVRAGFTLLELLIAIGIIAILASISLAVITVANRNSEQREAQNLLTLLDNALQEWESANDRPMSYGTDNQPSGYRYDVQEVPVNDAPFLIIDTVRVLNRVAAARDSIARVSNDFLRIGKNKANQDVEQVFDPWDRRILVVFPGRKWATGDSVRDDDGTIRTPFELRYGICRNRRPYFMSAGPDGKYGDLSLPITDQTYKDALDNQYSYEPIKP